MSVLSFFVHLYVLSVKQTVSRNLSTFKQWEWSPNCVKLETFKEGIDNTTNIKEGVDGQI